jgi:hypothetical protein
MSVSVQLVRRSDGSVLLVEGAVVRPVRSGLLAAALEQTFGAAGAEDDSTAGLPEGPPVDVFSTPSGQPFVVVDGHRCAVRGLPEPHRVDATAYDALPDGGTIDVARANVPRARLEQLRSQAAAQPRAPGARRGSTPTGLLRRAARKAKRTVTRLIR